MLDKIGKGLLIISLTASVMLGGYLGYTRYFVELQDRTVELCVDLNDMRKVAAFEKKPLGPILDEMKEQGIVSIGLFEETLPDAAAAGRLYYAKGSGIIRLKDVLPELKPLAKQGRIQLGKTYIYAPDDKVRKRVYNQLKWVVGENNIGFLGREVMEINEAEEELRGLGLGLPEDQVDYLTKKGLRIIPRIWNDPRYHLGNVGLKINDLAAHDVVIFEGEEILGYPEALKALSYSLKKNGLKYGYIEIVKQDGDKQLRRLMDLAVIRVHSVPKEELKKLNKDEVIDRFVRAVRERKVRLIYLRPFLPPQIDAYPVAYNLKFFGQVKDGLNKAGFIVGQPQSVPPVRVLDWQLFFLGIGIIIGAVFLLNYFIRLHIVIMYLLVALAAALLYLAGLLLPLIQLQKLLALATAVIFPSLAVISSLSREQRPSLVVLDATLIVLNVLAEAMVGVFLLIGIMADHRFMLGVETFQGVKLALLLPVMVVAFYFIIKMGTGSLKDRLLYFLNTRVKLATILLGVGVMGGLFVYLARSGNFVLPVPVFEKYFRNFMEALFFIRPRTKEFIIGYPLLYLAALAMLRQRKHWLWLLAALGTIAPISVLNTFSHIHTPLIISLIRTFNGLVIGVLVGALLVFIFDPFFRKEE
ncbi:MAG: hypothetical protein JW782_00645 [Candidatus Saganbacteria bacterium]|nr:hypothetical protein [Candidatus Saganbacteria bacterium]